MAEKGYVWEQSYAAAILETDNAKLAGCIAAANAAIASRLDELRMDQAGDPEEQKAIVHALSGLDRLKRERLGELSGSGLQEGADDTE